MNIMLNKSKLTGLCLLVLSALASLGVISCPLHAQLVGATLSGSITDPSGAVIPGAKISITDTATSVTRVVVSNTAGLYSAANLQPGPYQVTVSATGFTTKDESGLNLAVGQQQQLNVQMQVGQVSEKVEVTGAAPTVELSSSTLTSQVEQSTIVSLPLNGRDWTALALLEPGTVSGSENQISYTTSNSTQRSSRGFGAAMTIAGARPHAESFVVDGIVTNDYVNAAPGNALGVSLGVDAIQEFSVLSNNYTASYGRTGGGIVNAITRSGTNQFYGDAFEFARNSVFDARNFFDPAQIPPFTRNQFGGSIGGPILKDRTFFFAAYEGLRQNYTLTTLAQVPSAAMRNGYTCSSATDTTAGCSQSSIKSQITVSPAVQPYLGLWALPNDGLLGNGNTGYYRFPGTQIIGADYGFIRVDQHFSANDTLTGTYLDDTSNLTQPDTIGTVIVPQATANKRIMLAETHIMTSTTVNSFRFGFNRLNDFGGGQSCPGLRRFGCAVGLLNPLAGEASLGMMSGYDAPDITATGITAFNGGLSSQNYNWWLMNSFQGYDDLIRTVGKHNIQIGASFEHDQTYRSNYNNPAGGFAYGTLASFLQNGQETTFAVYLSPNSTPAGVNSDKNWRQTYYGFYVQDSYRVTKNLTLNLGVRYEPYTVPTENRGHISSLPTPTAATPITGDPIFANNSYASVQPRVGLAWDPFGTGKTSIRAGGGLYDVASGMYEMAQIQSQIVPFAQWYKYPKMPAGDFGPQAIPIAIANSAQNAGYIQQNPKLNTIEQYNLSIQREITPTLTVMAAYVGSHGVHNNFENYDMDYVQPTLTPAGYLWPTPIGSGSKLNPNPAYSGIFEEVWTGSSRYNGMEVQVTKQLSHNYQIQGSYTWGESMDTGSTGPYPATYANSLSEYFTMPGYSNWARSDYNVKENLVIFGTWNAPAPHLSSHLTDVALGGWIVQGIYTTHTGLPFTPTISGDPLGMNSATTNDFPDYNPGASGCPRGGVNPGNSRQYVNLNCFSLPMATPAIASECVPFASATVSGTCQNLLGTARRNDLIGPAYQDFDFSVMKNHQIRESLNLQLRAEAFNLFNKTNFAFPSTLTLYNATGAAVAGAGGITSTANYSRQLQFALKVMF